MSDPKQQKLDRFSRAAAAVRPDEKRLAAVAGRELVAAVAQAEETGSQDVEAPAPPPIERSAIHTQLPRTPLTGPRPLPIPPPLPRLGNPLAPAPRILPNANPLAADAAPPAFVPLQGAPMAAAAPLAGAPNPVEPLDEEDDEEGVQLEVEAVDGTGKRTRVTRKFTLWNFVVRDGASHSLCKCGCLDDVGLGRKRYSTPSSGLVKRHLAACHPHLLLEYSNLKANRGNLNQLLETIERLDGEALQQAAKKRRRSDSFWAKALKLEASVASDLRLLIWAISNGISRNSLNDPLFDTYLKSLGAQASPNRHALQESCLPILDRFVTDSFSSELNGIASVALSSDGWRDRTRRDWVNIILAFIVDSVTEKKWNIRVIEPDLILIPGSATANTIALLINESLERILPADCLKSSSTTDGAKNEIGAAFRLVNEDNAIHCYAHNIQLCVNDPLDPTKPNAPPQCARHREVIRKAHGLVIYINGHKAAHNAFIELIKAKRQTEEGAKMYESLIEDVVTRWDSELNMLERIYYFDKEILTLSAMPGLGIPADLILDRFEFDLAYAMTKVLTPLRIFTKFVQQKEVVTLAYVPRKLDELVSSLAPGSFAAVLQGCADGVLPLMEAFQACLVESIHARFDDTFSAESLAMAARMLLPSRDLFVFQNFEVLDETLEAVKDNLIQDFGELLSPGLTEAKKDRQKTLARATFEVVREALDETPEDVDPLRWWPSHPEYTLLFPLAKMLLQIPASSAENERSFSSASFVLDQRRTRLDLDNFRREHRIRRRLCAGTTGQQKLAIANDLIERYAAAVQESRDGEAAPQ